MSATAPPDAVARRAAASLVDLDRTLPAQVEQALVADPLAASEGRPIDPISLGALIVSIVALGWTIFHDLQQDHAAAKLDRNEKAELLRTELQSAAPASLPPKHRGRILRVIATEIVAIDLGPTSATPAPRG